MLHLLVDSTNGNSNNATHKNAKQFKANALQEQNRTQRTPTDTTNKNIPKQEVNNSPESTQYPNPAKQPATPGTTAGTGDKQPTKEAKPQDNPDKQPDDKQGEQTKAQQATPNTDATSNIKTVMNSNNCPKTIHKIKGPYDIIAAFNEVSKINADAINDMPKGKGFLSAKARKRVDEQYDVIIYYNPACVKQ